MALVLPGGGAHAAYQVGVLAGIVERLPTLEFPILTGVSAGAINIAYLATYRGPLARAVETLRREWGRLSVERVYRIKPGRLARAGLRWLGERVVGRHVGPTVVHGLLDMDPLRQFLAASLDFGGIEANLTAGGPRAGGVCAPPSLSGANPTLAPAR